MKTATKTKILHSQSAAKNATGETFSACPTVEELTKEFLEAENRKAKRNDGKNNYVADFAWVSQALISTCGSDSTFSFHDAIIFARHLETPLEELRNLFDKWTKYLKSKSRLQSIEGCYDFTVFSFT